MTLYTMIDGHWVATTLDDYFHFILSNKAKITIDVEETRKFNRWLSDREQNKQQNNRR